MSKSKYVMEYCIAGEQKKEYIYASTLKKAKIEARKIAEEKDLGIMYGLKFESY